MSTKPPEQIDIVDPYDALSRLASLHYAALARDAWALALLRALQLGVTALVAQVPLAWHAAPGALDLSGATHPQRDLLGLIGDCERVGLGLILALQCPAEPEAGCCAAWMAELGAALAPRQSPSGPIVALYLDGAPAVRLAQQLRADGWHVPIMPRLTALDLNFGAGRPLLRADASARTAFWRAKLPRLLLSAAGDVSHIRAPADLALLLDGSASADPLAHALADRLRHARIAFHQLELANTTSAEIARYVLVLASQSAVSQPSAAPLGPLSNLALLGEGGADLPEAFCYKPRLPAGASADQVAETLEALGGRARYAWADSPGLGIELRYGQTALYLTLQNEQPAPYHGMLAYRGRDGAVLHLQVGMGGGRSGGVMLSDDEVRGAAIDGEAAEGGWFTRGQQSGIAFNNGPGALVACGAALIATAAQSGRFQARRPAGWHGMAAHRLLLNGVLLPAELQIEASHLTLPYVAEDEYGQTDCYLVLDPTQPLPGPVRSYLAGLLRARAAALRQWSRLAGGGERPGVAQAAAELGAASAQLEDAAGKLATLVAYERTWALIAGPVQRLIRALAAHEASQLDVTQRLANLPGWLLA